MSKSKRFFRDLDTPEQLLAEFDEKREYRPSDSQDRLEDWVISNSNSRLDSFYRDMRCELYHFIQDLLTTCPSLSRAVSGEMLNILANEVYEAFSNPRENGDYGRVKRGLQEQIAISMARFLVKALENASEHQRHVQTVFVLENMKRFETAESQPESVDQ